MIFSGNPFENDANKKKEVAKKEYEKVAAA
jgi:hypothetical protein